MNPKQKRLMAWVKVHRKQLVIAGISVVAIVGIVLFLKNKEAISELEATLENNITKGTERHSADATTVQESAHVFELEETHRSYTAPQSPFNVSPHIRTMKEGKHHSAKKAAQAATLKIDLRSNQTLVDAYTKYAA